MEQVTATGQMITLIHFTYQSGEEWRIACMPEMIEFHQTPYHPNYARANDVRAITCPACKESLVFRRHKNLLETMLKGSVRG